MEEASLREERNGTVTWTSAELLGARWHDEVSAFFCEALMRCDAPHASELLGVALRVCDRVRYFVDREEWAVGGGG